MMKEVEVIAHLVKAGHNDLADQLTAILTSGVIKYPPQMYEAIREWVMQVYGSWVVLTTEDSAVENAAAKLTGNKPIKKPPKSAHKTFKVDLRNLDASHYPIDRMTQLTDKIPVFIDVITLTNKRGGWVSYPVTARKLTVVLTGPLIDVSSVGELSNRKAEIETAIQHELQHMVQTLVADAQGIPDSQRGKEVALDIPAKDKYLLNPLEFQTWILSSKHILLTELQKIKQYVAIEDVPLTREDFDRFVGNPKPVVGKMGQMVGTSDFFKALYTYDRDRWKLAIREFYKIMIPLLGK